MIRCLDFPPIHRLTRHIKHAKPHVVAVAVLLPCKLAVLGWLVSTRGFAGPANLINRAAAEPIIMISEPSPFFLLAGAILLTMSLRRFWFS